MRKLMKMNYLLFIASISVASSSSLPRADNKIQKAGNFIGDYNWPKFVSKVNRFPHQTSCSQFYKLDSDGGYHIQECPEGQMFDYFTLSCVQTTLVRCWISETGPGYVPKKLKRHFKCPFPWGKYPDTEDCSKFFSCHNGKDHHKRCPHSKLFDKVDRMCVAETEALCADITDGVDPNYKCPYLWGVYSHPKDCTKYYECFLKKPSLWTCKRGALFDAQERICRQKTEVDCGKRQNPYGDILTSEVELKPTMGFNEERKMSTDGIRSEKFPSEITDLYSSAPDRFITGTDDKSSVVPSEITGLFTSSSDQYFTETEDKSPVVPSEETGQFSSVSNTFITETDDRTSVVPSEFTDLFTSSSDQYFTGTRNKSPIVPSEATGQFSSVSGTFITGTDNEP